MVAIEQTEEQRLATKSSTKTIGSLDTSFGVKMDYQEKWPSGYGARFRSLLDFLVFMP